MGWVTGFNDAVLFLGEAFTGSRNESQNSHYGKHNLLPFGRTVTSKRDMAPLSKALPELWRVLFRLQALLRPNLPRLQGQP